MIRRYLSTETVFNHNKYVLKPFKVEVDHEANALFEVMLELPKGTVINKRDIVTVPTPQGVQPFRVYRITKTLYGIRAFAKHIFYDLADALILDARPTNTNCNGALQSIINASGMTGWTYFSDITDFKTAYYIRKNPIEAIIGADNSVLNIWGGNLIRDNKEIRILASGIDRGYEIRLGKNLIGIEDDSDDSNVTTRLYPTYEKNQVIYDLPEKYIDSPLIGGYPNPIVKEIRVSLTDDEKEFTDAQIHTILRVYCNNLYSVDNVDKPIANYKIDFVELSKIARIPQERKYTYAGMEQLTYNTIETLTYAELEGTTVIEDFMNLLEKVDIHDIVTVNVSELDIDLQAKVIKYKYDGLGEKYISIEIGGFKSSNQYQINNIVKQLQTDKAKASSEYAELYDMAINKVTGNNGGFKITRLNANNEPYEDLYMDTDDINTAQNVLRINQNGIAGSNNGINGPYPVAITIDGWIVGERILVNSLSAISADLGTVTTGRMRSPDGSVDINLNDKTFNIGSEGESVNTGIKYNGLEIKDVAKVVATFGETGAVMPELDVGIIKSSDLIQPIGTQILYVGGYGYTSIQSALSALFPAGKKFINGIITVEIGIDSSETVEIVNLVGGKLILKLINGAKLYGNIYIANCSTEILIKAEGLRASILSTEYEAIKVVASRFVKIQSLDISANMVAVHAVEGSGVYLDDNDTGATPYYGVLAEEGSLVRTYNNRGSNTVSLEARTSSVIFTHNSTGQGLKIGHIISHTPSTSPSIFAVPPIVSQTFIRLFSNASLDTLSNGSLPPSSYYGSNAAQNRWPGNLTYSVGRIRMDDSIKKFIEGATSSSARMRLRRKNTSHGTTSAIPPTPSFGMGSVSGAVRGGWSGWGAISTALFGDAVDLRFGSNVYANYAIWDAIEIEVTVTKNV